MQLSENEEIYDEKVNSSFVEPSKSETPSTDESKTNIQKSIKKLEDEIFKAFQTGQRKIRRKKAKKLKINWKVYLQIEKNIVNLKYESGECSLKLFRKINNKGVK